ncbi:unnamed protein product [Choristocarpus tenellus]
MEGKDVLRYTKEPFALDLDEVRDLQMDGMGWKTPKHTFALEDNSLDMDEATNAPCEDAAISSSLKSNGSLSSLSKWVMPSPVKSIRGAVRRLGSIISPVRSSLTASKMRRKHISESDLRPWDADCWTVSTRSIRGFRHSATWNEDAFKVTNDLFGEEGAPQRPPSIGKVGLYAVFDGHGGRACSHFAADVIALAVARSPAWAQLTDHDNSHDQSAYRNCGEDIFDLFTDSYGDGKKDTTPMPIQSPLITERRQEFLKSVMVQVLEDGFRMTELAFELQEKRLLGNSGSTAVVALICSGWLVIANLGDAGGMYYNDGDSGDDGGPKIVHTKAHSFQNPDERARVKQAGGYFENGRLFGMLEPSRGLGDNDIRRVKEGVLISTPEVIVQRIVPARLCAFLVLGSDGLWGAMSSAKIIKAVQSGVRRQRLRKSDAKEVQVATTITRLAASAEEGDDITAVVVMIG